MARRLVIKIGRDRDTDNVLKILRVPRQRAEFLDKPLILPLEECLQQLGPVGEIVVDQGRRNRRGFGKSFHGKRLQTLADQQGLGCVQQLLTASIG